MRQILDYIEKKTLTTIESAQYVVIFIGQIFVLRYKKNNFTLLNQPESGCDQMIHYIQHKHMFTVFHLEIFFLFYKHKRLTMMIFILKFDESIGKK